MRFHLILILAGISLMAIGIGWAWYYASEVYPAEAADAEKYCLQHNPPAPCVSLAPASEQGSFVLGESVAGFGLVLILAGAFLRVGFQPRQRVGDSR